MSVGAKLIAVAAGVSSSIHRSRCELRSREGYRASFFLVFSENGVDVIMGVTRSSMDLK